MSDLLTHDSILAMPAGRDWCDEHGLTFAAANVRRGERGGNVFLYGGMTTMAHTPGPWAVNDSPQYHNGGPNLVWGPQGPGCGTVCELAYAPGEGAISDNARLIAAAPDLLVACEALVQAAKDAHEHWDADRDMKVGKLLSAMAGFLPKYRAALDAAHAAIRKAKGGAT